jgi:c-di-GMP-binding flagellar brake protein YcgR
MILNFDLENIKYLKIEYKKDNLDVSQKLALKEKKENSFIAVMPIAEDVINEEIPKEVDLSFVCTDGLYKTTTYVESVSRDEEYIIVEFQNPKTLDYQQNRAFYRVMVEFDCVYTMETDDGMESFNAVTYDISAGGVSIISAENTIPTREVSIIIYTPERSIKSYLKFVRCESFEDEYKLSFIFIDLEERDVEFLTKLCVDKQCNLF